MGLHRLLGEDEGAGDLAVGAAVGDQAEHLAFAFGQGAAAPLALAVLVLAEEGAGDLGLEEDVAGVDGADGAGQRLGVDVLVDVSPGAGAQGGDHGALLGEAGDDQDAGGVGQFPQAAQGLDAVHAGHLDVHQDDVGLELLGAGHALGAVAGLADHLDVVLDLQEGAQAAADHLVVVDEEDPDDLGVPFLALGVSHRVPPSRSWCPCRAPRAR